MRPLLLLAALAVACPAFAGGFDLTWDACPGSPAAKTNAIAPCSDPDATQSLYVVFEPNADMANFVALEFHMRLLQENTEPQLAPFWYFGDHGCNPGFTLSAVASAALCPGTISPWISPATEYRFDLLAYEGRERGRLRGTVVRNSTTPLTVHAGQRYFAYRLEFSMEAASLLEGCPTPMVVGIREIVLHSITDDPQILANPVSGWYCVNLNGAQGVECGVAVFPPPGPGEVPVDRSCGETAGRSVTWGAIKGLYR